MSCLGVTGKPMVVTVKCGVESDILGSEWESNSNMELYSTNEYYGKDFTRIVLELIGALEQRITLV